MGAHGAYMRHWLVKVSVFAAIIKLVGTRFKYTLAITSNYVI